MFPDRGGGGLKILDIGDTVCSEAGSEGGSEGCAKSGRINIR